MTGSNRTYICGACSIGECGYCSSSEVWVPGVGVAVVPRSCWCDHGQAARHGGLSQPSSVLMDLVEVTATSVRVGDVLVSDGRERTVRDMLAVGSGRKNLVFDDGGTHAIGMTPLSAYRPQPLPARRDRP